MGQYIMYIIYQLNYLDNTWTFVVNIVEIVSKLNLNEI